LLGVIIRPAFESPERVASQIAKEWAIELGQPFASSSYAFVAPAGDCAMLKVTSAVDDEADEEPDALAFWNGDGAVRLLRADTHRRAMLLERALPGGDLSKLGETEATSVAVELGQRLWREAGRPFRWIGDHVPRWLEQADRANNPARALVGLARELYSSLDVGRSTLVHGDFHHHNILVTGRGHVAIDPKPMLGEREFDVPPFLWNPIDQRMTLELAQARVEAFTAAGLDAAKMRAWAVIRGAYLGVDQGEAGVLRALIE
jgi:streptomycin 6-kinase